MLEEWDNIEIIANELFPKLSTGFVTNQTVCLNVKNDCDTRLNSFIECLTEYGNDINKRMDNNVDKPFNDKLLKMYEDTKNHENETMLDQNQFSSLLESKTTSDLMISKQIKVIEERNIESSIKSLELLFLYCDNVLSHHIESAAKSMEQVIPQLNRNISLNRKEFSESHNSLELLDAAVYENYCVLRDGYKSLIQNYYSESVAQLALTSKLECEKDKWHISKIKRLVDSHHTGTHRERERQNVSNEHGSLFSKACDATFQHLLTHNHFEEAEEACRRLEVVRRSVYEWKSRITAHCEEALNTSLEVQEACFMSHIEELTQTLQDLQTVQPKLFCYSKTLEHRCRTLVGLHEQELMEREQMRDRGLAVDDHEMFGGDSGDNQAAIRAMEIEDSSLRIGTRLYAAALSQGMAPEEVEQLLLQMVPSATESFGGNSIPN